MKDLKNPYSDTVEKLPGYEMLFRISELLKQGEALPPDLIQYLTIAIDRADGDGEKLLQGLGLRQKNRGRRPTWSAPLRNAAGYHVVRLMRLGESFDKAVKSVAADFEAINDGNAPPENTIKEWARERYALEERMVRHRQGLYEKAKNEWPVMDKQSRIETQRTLNIMGLMFAGEWSEIPALKKRNRKKAKPTNGK
ncbi:MAG: hypothetical protein LRY66_02885 [Saccharospirillaceae bacterium]|nr:hypothetical protein [Saccharospirillaceae bacterium]MCD8530309.1 hypothetical protein [Saccharospirillaceae bacterium]